MQLVFLNSLEKPTEEGRVRTSQVSITEHQGAWRVLWNELREDGNPGQDCWYEGPYWQELLQAYREGLKMKRNEGYIPLIDHASEQAWAPRNREVLALQYYGEKHRNEEVWQKLRQWRREQAVSEGKSAYFIATNRMLDMLSAFLPHMPEELRAIPGFGQRKVEAYGHMILAITREFTRNTAFPLDWVSEDVSEEELNTWQIEQLRVREKQEQERLVLQRRLLEGIMAGAKLGDLEQQLGLKRQDITRLVEDLDREGYDIVRLVDAELAAVEEPEGTRIQALFQQMGDRFLKPILRKLYTEEELGKKDVGRLYEQLRLQRIRYRHQPAVPVERTEPEGEVESAAV